MQTPFSPKPHRLGHSVEKNDVTVFFGNRESSRESLLESFPDYELVILNQTHSDIVVASTLESVKFSQPEADAHFTQDKKLALCVRTADCLPVLIHSPESGAIAAIHAGWRGIENEIILKTCARLTREGFSMTKAHAWIGPHISNESFEVGRDVALKLAARFDAVRGFAETSIDPIEQHPDSQKAFVNLLAIALAQLNSVGFESERVTALAIDTMTSIEHASFRRDREQAGRQMSFIALK